MSRLDQNLPSFPSDAIRLGTLKLVVPGYEDGDTRRAAFRRLAALIDKERYYTACLAQQQLECQKDLPWFTPSQRQECETCLATDYQRFGLAADPDLARTLILQLAAMASASPKAYLSSGNSTMQRQV